MSGATLRAPQHAVVSMLGVVLPDATTLAMAPHAATAGSASSLQGLLLFLVGAAGDRQGFAAAHDGTPAPVAWLPEALSGVLGVAGLLGVVLLLLGSVVAVWRRLRRAAGDERLQLLWLVWGALTVPVTLLTTNGTSQAAEVFAAALVDNDRAKIVGERTLGRAAAQKLIVERFDDTADKRLVDEAIAGI